MKRIFRTDKFHMHDDWYAFFQKHAEFESNKNGLQKLIDIEINDDFIQLIQRLYIDSLKVFFGCVYRKPACKWIINGTVSNLEQKEEKDKKQFYKNLYLGKDGFNDYGNNGVKTILCEAFIDEKQQIFFDTNYEFEAPEIHISSDCEIKILSAEHPMKKALSEEEKMDCLHLEPEVEWVDLKLQDLHKAIYLCYLKYPEGFKFENIGQSPYKKFISDTYINISPRTNNEKLLNNLFTNGKTKSEAKTRINKAIEETAGDYASFYTLSEKSDKTYFVRVRSLYPEAIKNKSTLL